MFRSGRFAVLTLALTLGCGDLTRVPPPPVPLSALSTPFAGVAGNPETRPVSSVRLARSVSPDALVVLHVPDIKGTSGRLRQTALYEFFTAPPFKAAFKPITVQITPGGESESGKADLGTLFGAVQGEFVFSLDDIKLDDKDNLVSANVLVALSLRDSGPLAEQVLAMITRMAASSRKSKIEKGSVEGVVFTRIRTPGKPVVEVALHREAIFFGIGAETVTGAITRLRKGRGQSIVSSATYQRAMERCGDPHDAVRLHVNTSAILGRLAGNMPPELLRALQAVGLSEWNALTVAVRPQGRDLAVSTFIDSPGGKDIITRAIGRHPADRQFLARLPKDISSFSLFALEGAEVLAGLREALPPEGLKELDQFLDFAKTNGIDVEKDVLQVFGPRGCLVTIPHGRVGAKGMDAIWNLVLGTAMIVDVKDPVAAERLLAKLPNGGENVRRRVREVNGVKVTCYVVDVTDVPDEFAPCYAYVDEFLVVALSEDAMEGMLRPGPAESAQELRDLLKDVPDMASIITYDDTRLGLRMMFDTVMNGLYEAMGTGMMETPKINFEDLTRGWNKTLSYTVADERGIFMHTVSPTAGIGSFGGLGGLFMLGSIAVPNFAHARQRNNESAAISTLRRIHNAQRTFRGAGVRDADADGKGEHGFLSELLGRGRTGERTIRQRTALLSGLAWSRGTYVSKGYRFRIYLPSEDGSPIGGHEAAERVAHVDGDLSESIAIVVAWPEGRTSGRRAFILDTDGTIYACVDGDYVGTDGPPPDVLREQAGNLASRRLPAKSARDGNRWERVRH